MPEPRTNEPFTGKFVVRVPRSQHRQLVDAAEHDGVSLNMFVNVALAQTVGEAFKIQRHLLFLLRLQMHQRLAYIRHIGADRFLQPGAQFMRFDHREFTID